MGVAVRRPLASLNPNHSAEIFAHELSKSSFAVCFRARLIIFTIRYLYQLRKPVFGVGNRSTHFLKEKQKLPDKNLLKLLFDDPIAKGVQVAKSPYLLKA